MTAGSSNPDTNAQLLRALTSLKEMRGRLEAAEAARTEPIAVIGIGCRLPGAANPSELWELLRSGGDAITETPAERWDAAGIYDPAPEAAGKVATRWGGFLDGIDQFDAAFFGISPREAAQMDPQQRLVLEVAWEALEDAGQVAERLAGSATGVFVGVHSHSEDYYLLQAADPRGLDLYSGTGTSHSVVSGRLSYLLDLRGPSLAIDTACSSSLVAVHLAVQSLRNRECSMALAGGVNAIIDPTFTMVASRMRMMSPSGRCRPFDAAADGFVRAEGCATVVLKRLSDAIDDGDRVHAVILGSAVNQDGRSNGLTAPNSLSQQAVIRAALATAGVQPRAIGLIEAHGTGTPLGDPIEVEALTEVFGETDGRSCALGSVKANIGHTEGAAGVAGLIKAVLAVRAGEIPPMVHFERLSPHISLAGTPFVIPTAPMAWSEPNGPRLAGVSSFGWSGTNVHLVVGEVASSNPPEPVGLDTQALLLPISARSAQARRELAVGYRDLLATSSESAIADICVAAGVRRSHHDHRLAVAGRDRGDLIAQIDAFLDDQQHRGLSVGERSHRPALVAFVFPGQGSQWDGMARGLMAVDPVFRDTIARCGRAMAQHVRWSLVDMLAGTADRHAHTLNDIDVVQPALFAIQVALAAVWRARGVEPAVVVGHSMGEVAAAHVAGILSLDDAARVVCRRSLLLRRIGGRGSMAVVELDIQQSREVIAGLEDRLAIAVSNSATSTVLSGDTAALDDVMARLESAGVFCRRVKVDVASHSPQVDELHDELVAALAGIDARPATIPFFSTVTTSFEEGPALDASYWARNLRQPVMFADAVHELIETDHTRFVELSPHPLLIPAIQESLARAGRKGVSIASMQRDSDEPVAMAAALGALYADGHDIDWLQIAGDRHPTADLPMYPWQRERHWLETERRAVDTGRDLLRDDVDETKAPLEDWLYSIEWRAAADAGVGDSRRIGTWFVLAGEGAHGDALAEALRATGVRCVVVRRGSEYARTDADRFVVRPDADDLRRVFDDVGSDGVAVVSLWGLDARDTDAGAIDLEQGLVGGCGELLSVIGAVNRRQPRLPVWIVTEGVHRVIDTDVAASLAQAPLWGLGRAVADELPDVLAGLVDLETASDPAQSAHLLAGVITAADSDCAVEGEIAVRGGIRYVSRLVRQTIGADAPLRLRADSTYLVTGGFGAVGRHLAPWLVANGARRLVLLGRTQLPARAAWAALSPETPAGRRVELIQELERLGVAVHAAAVDVGDEAALRDFLAQFRAEGWPPIRGVFHAAAVLGGQLVDQIDAKALAEQLAPKVIGARVLAEQLHDLDHFVLFSSIASVFPTAGQGAYAAANAFLDALAHHRAARGLPAVSVNWGFWEGSSELLAGEVGQSHAADGPTYKDTANALAESQGMRGFSTEAGLAVLGRLMLGNRPQTVVVPVDWSAFAAARIARPLALASDLLAEEARNGAPAAGASAPHAPSLVDQLSSIEGDERVDLIDTAVRRIVGRVLKMHESRIDLGQPFGSLGLDSLMGIELRNGLEAEFGLKMSATVAWNYPTVTELGAYVLSRLGLAVRTAVDDGDGESTAGQTRAGAADLGTIAAGVAELSDDEVLSALIGKVDS